MAFVIIIGLIVTVISLLIVNSQLKKENKTLAASTKNTRRKKNATKL